MPTIAELQTRLSEYRAAESRILRSQEYSVGQGGAARRNRRPELERVQTKISELELQIDKHPDNPATRGARRIRYLRPAG